jgi:hypothetical protein
MNVLIAIEDEMDFKELTGLVLQNMPNAKCTQMFLIDAGSWFMANEPDVVIIDSLRHPEDAHDLLRLVKETNAGHGKRSIVIYRDEAFRSRCERNGYVPDAWIETPINEEKIAEGLGVKKEAKKRRRNVA